MWSGGASRSLKRGAYALACWTAIVLVYSTRNDMHGLPLTPSQAIKAAAARWYVWAALSYFIIQVDKRLPLADGSLWKRFLVHIPISWVFIAAYTWLNYWVSIAIQAPLDTSVSSADGPVTVLFRAITRPSNLVYWVVLITHVVLTYEREKRDQELKTAKLERLLADARLAALRSQLHPHFLFNALNAVSAYIDTAPRVARLMLEQMAELLRMSLARYDSQEIPLEEELAFLDKYLALQKLRFEDRLEVNIRIHPDASDAAVPTFILQPLVENAVRHGIAAHHDCGLIEVNAWRSNGDLGISVRDDGPGLPAGWSITNSGGLGLRNTRERLRTLYGSERERFDIRSAPNGGTVVQLTLPFQRCSPGQTTRADDEN